MTAFFRRKAFLFLWTTLLGHAWRKSCTTFPIDSFFCIAAKPASPQRLPLNGFEAELIIINTLLPWTRALVHREPLVSIIIWSAQCIPTPLLPPTFEGWYLAIKKSKMRRPQSVKSVLNLLSFCFSFWESRLGFNLGDEVVLIVKSDLEERNWR